MKVWYYLLGPSACVIICAPRSKIYARGLIGAASGQRLVIVDGPKTDGIDSLFKDCRKRLGALPSLTKAHGRIFWFEDADLSDWPLAGPETGQHGFFTVPGVYSEAAIDKGSALLAEVLPDLKGRIADLGAGWGYLSQAALLSDKVTSLDLVEADQRALNCARLNIIDDRASFHWADATTHRGAEAYDAVVMNPPFHQGRQGDPSLGQAFIAAAARNLKPNGALWMVANRHLPYEAALEQAFRTVDELDGNTAFKVFHASRPKR